VNLRAVVTWKTAQLQPDQGLGFGAQVALSKGSDIGKKPVAET